MNPPPWTYRPDFRRTEFTEDADLADILARALRVGGNNGRRPRRGELGVWAIEEDEVWVIAAPRGRHRPDQGWKLHLSATVYSARSVLARVLPILLAQRCHFKFARSLRQLEILNGIGCPEGISGKFLTVYPDDDAMAVDLARRLDEVSAGLDGPRILSDRPFRPGSLVHVRYGAFGERAVFTSYGVLLPVIAAPDGSPIEDRRLGRFAPPAWAPDPFVAPVDPSAVRAAGDGDLMIGDYRVEAALKRANRGGTYRGRSRASGQEIVLKEARPHVATDRFGRDARDRLQHEFAMLTRLSQVAGREERRLAPRPLALFERSEHLFLAREYLRGLTLRTVVRRRAGGSGGPFSESDLRAFVASLADMLHRFHSGGIVARDLNPNNLLLLSECAADESRFAMVDLELAADASGVSPPFRGATLAYASPQQEDDLAPTPADDLFSLGATLAFVVTAADPFVMADGPLGRSKLDKIEERLALHRCPRWTAEVVIGCLSPVPDERPTAADVLTLTARRKKPGGTMRRVAEPRLPTDAQLLEAIDGFVDFLAASWEGESTDRVWPATAFGSTTDPLNVAHGAAGVGLYLAQALRACRSGPSGPLLDRLVSAIGDSLGQLDSRPTGLYYGRAGLAWFLADAGDALDRPGLTQSGLDLLTAIPATGESPEVMNGTAGLILAAARLFRATGEVALIDRIGTGVSALEDAAEWTENGLRWRIPANHAVDLVGKTYPGYAYGLSGIAYAALCAAAITGRLEAADLAASALRSLLAWRQERDGRRWWPTSSHATAGSPCWLKGAAGIGAGLARAAILTGDPDYREAALDCWRLLRPAPRHGPLTQLNGLAAVGELCLDLADLLGVEEARADAWDIARTMYAQRIDRRFDGYGICFPDEDGLVGADLLTGGAGVASFLLRLVDRTPRLMMIDDLLGSIAAPEARP